MEEWGGRGRGSGRGRGEVGETPDEKLSPGPASAISTVKCQLAFCRYHYCVAVFGDFSKTFLFNLIKYPLALFLF